MKVQLSYSTLNMVYTASHNYLNKMMGLKPEDHDYYHEGKEAHRIIQDHVSGKKIDDRLKNIKFKFPIVEEVDFDERCKFVYSFKADGLKNEYEIIGFIDGLNTKEKRMLEIKTSTQPWSVIQFQKSLQRKVYALALFDIVETIGVTAVKDPDQWIKIEPKVYKIPNTQQDRDEALAWILGGIKIIESGNFKGGLNEEGKCTDPRCYYGKNCQFK